MNIIEPTGELRLTFRRKSNGVTYAAKQFFKLPLQIMPPFYQDDDGTAFVYMLNLGGGILQHDRIKTEIVLEENSKAFITTPSAAKFYKMDEGCAMLQSRLDVAAGGVLEYMPGHNVPFAHSSVFQETEFHLHEKAVLIASDMTTPGRIARGELFEYNIYDSKIKIFAGGEIIAFDRCLIEPGKMPLRGTGIMENNLINGTVYVYAKGCAEELAALINGITHAADVYTAAGAVSGDLVVTRFLANKMIDLHTVQFGVWDAVRRRVLGKPGVRIRKY